jgi:hypothetical protein
MDVAYVDGATFETGASRRTSPSECYRVLRDQLPFLGGEVVSNDKSKELTIEAKNCGLHSGTQADRALGPAVGVWDFMLRP